MDDDLMSLRSNVSSSKSDDDDLLGGFGSSPATKQPGGWVDTGDPADLDFGSLGEQPEWLHDLEVEPETAAPVKGTAEKTKVERPRRPRKSSGKSKGMTPQQRMILALFLFGEVAAISILVLFAIGAINLP